MLPHAHLDEIRIVGMGMERTGREYIFRDGDTQLVISARSLTEEELWAGVRQHIALTSSSFDPQLARRAIRTVRRNEEILRTHLLGKLYNSQMA